MGSGLFTIFINSGGLARISPYDIEIILFQYQDIHPIPEDIIRDRRRISIEEERHRDDNPEPVARLPAAAALPAHAPRRRRHTEVGAPLPRAAPQGAPPPRRASYPRVHQRCKQCFKETKLKNAKTYMDVC